MAPLREGSERARALRALADEIASHGSGEVGGLARSEDVRPGGPLVVLFSDNLEASLEAVNAAGGRIVKEVFSFPGGRRFHFADPSGNELLAWRSGTG